MMKFFILLSLLIVLVSTCYLPNSHTTHRTTTNKSVTKVRCDIWCRLKKIVLYIIQQLLSDD